MMTPADIERRLPVWHALSDIFLDTELQPEDYAMIAAVLRRSGYSVQELRAIFDDEVRPVFVGNLLSVAGEWQSWSEDDVRRLMQGTARSHGKLSLMRWLMKLPHRRHLQKEWERIACLLGADAFD